MDPIVAQLDIVTNPLNASKVARFGYLCQYFAVGLVYGGLPATTYGVLVGYLNVPSFVYATATNVLTLPWSFKFLFGAINDCMPILGYRRKPYMVMGWAFCAAFLFLLSRQPMPAPYWCFDEVTQSYLLDRPPCNPDAATMGGSITLLMTLAALGYVVADVAADGLTVQYARNEPESKRGYIQSTAYMTRTFGQIAAYCLVGFGMNGKKYLGTFSVGLSFPQVALVFATTSALMVPISACTIHEAKRAESERTTGRMYLAATWQMLKSKAFFFVLLFQFLNPAIQYVNSTATVCKCQHAMPCDPTAVFRERSTRVPLMPMHPCSRIACCDADVQRYWAEVETLQNQLMNVAGYLLFSLGLLCVRERYLGASWRLMLALTTVSLYVIDAPFQFLTIFGVVRNQYFFLGATLLSELPDAIFFVVSCFVIVEMAEE